MWFIIAMATAVKKQSNLNKTTKAMCKCVGDVLDKQGSGPCDLRLLMPLPTAVLPDEAPSTPRVLGAVGPCSVRWGPSLGDLLSMNQG